MANLFSLLWGTSDVKVIFVTGTLLLDHILADLIQLSKFIWWEHCGKPKSCFESTSLKTSHDHRLTVILSLSSLELKECKTHNYLTLHNWIQTEDTELLVSSLLALLASNLHVIHLCHSNKAYLTTHLSLNRPMSVCVCVAGGFSVYDCVWWAGTAWCCHIKT